MEPAPAVVVKPKRWFVYTAAALAALLIGFVTYQAEPNGSVRDSAQFGGWVTIWLCLGISAGGVVWDVIRFAIERWGGK